MRFNGRGLLSPEGVFCSFGRRTGTARSTSIAAGYGPRDGPLHAAEPQVGAVLTPRQQAWIAAADTFFHRELPSAGRRGRVASRRAAGFVQVLGPSRLAFADYPGNNMFKHARQTCPSTRRRACCSWTFVSGDLLQLAGRARVEPDFSVVFEVDEVRATAFTASAQTSEELMKKVEGHSVKAAIRSR
jgi:hypothetical protein